MRQQIKEISTISILKSASMRGISRWTIRLGPGRRSKGGKHMKNALIVAVLVIGLLISGTVLRAVLFPVNTLDKSIDTAYQVVDKTLDGDNAIYNYEWFKEQEAHIRASLRNEEIAKEEYDLYIEMLPEDRESWTREDKQEESSLRNSYYALQKLSNLAIEDYNAKSEMVSRNIFKDNLPSNITRAWYAGRKLTK